MRRIGLRDHRLIRRFRIERSWIERYRINQRRRIGGIGRQHGSSGSHSGETTNRAQARNVEASVSAGREPLRPRVVWSGDNVPCPRPGVVRGSFPGDSDGRPAPAIFFLAKEACPTAGLGKSREISRTGPPARWDRSPQGPPAPGSAGTVPAKGVEEPWIESTMCRRIWKSP